MAMPFAPHAARARSWWNERSERERVLLTVLGGLALLALLVLFVVRPLQAARAQALADIRTYRTLSDGLAAGGVRPAGSRRAEPAARMLATTAAGFGLTVQRVEPEGGGTRVVMDGVPYDATMRWLADLEGAGVRLSEIRLDRGAAPGRVNMQLVVRE